MEPNYGWQEVGLNVFWRWENEDCTQASIALKFGDRVFAKKLHDVSKLDALLFDASVERVKRRAPSGEIAL